MTNTTNDWSNYVQAEGRNLSIRDRRNRDWTDAVTFTLDEAEDVADYVLEVADKARRNLPEVRELVADLEGSSAESLEELALTLFRKGYTKPSQ